MLNHDATVRVVNTEYTEVGLEGISLSRDRLSLYIHKLCFVLNSTLALEVTKLDLTSFQKISPELASVSLWDVDVVTRPEEGRSQGGVPVSSMGTDDVIPSLFVVGRRVAPSVPSVFANNLLTSRKPLTGASTEAVLLYQYGMTRVHTVNTYNAGDISARQW